ncbi:LAMI_0H00474g1_1 [Lachancea mirantina]|uniref:LAMI_0H00474g1_1 n=1 Tax=Lachancea mirantina TaxID=1230905 RepID=A0A1G4KDG4_9SACH|nr:LAMI_0H00474g1_1 [Lachancea mirantina]
MLQPTFQCFKRAALSPCTIRTIHTSRMVLNSSQNSSLFGSITQSPQENVDDPNQISNRLTAASERSGMTDKDAKATVTVDNDNLLQKYIAKKQSALPASKYLLSPLKRRIYEENCKLNGGFYNRDSVVSLKNEHGSSSKYKLRLSHEEIDLLEPSVYVKSYRIKSSMKKATQLLRLLNGLDAKTALSQCHFSTKKISRDVGALLTRGLEDAEKLGLDPNDLYIGQIWTGSDGNWQKRVDIKARGRNGVITHPYVHVRCILKTKSITKRRLAFEKQVRQGRSKPWVPLADKPVRGIMGGVYKW